MRSSFAEMIVLLNSDTCVTPGWTNKLEACLASDPAIGVASPLTNFAPNLVIPMLPGMDYLEMNALLEQRWDGVYPDVTTPEGFCFAIARRCLATVGYFDEAYDQGYGEESDFAMRAGYHGFRTVCGTNTFIYHRGRASFGEQRREDLYKSSRRVFNHRWSNKFPGEVEEFRGRDPVGAARRRLFSPGDERLERAISRPPSASTPVLGVTERPLDSAERWRAPDALSVLCVLPTLNPYGGVISVAAHLNVMIEAGHKVTLFSMSRVKRDFTFLRTEPIFLPRGADVLDLVPGPHQVLLATSWETVPYISRAVARLPQATPVYYVQDIEGDFYEDRPEIREQALATYGMLPNLIVKTSHLQRRLASLGWKAHLIPPGMDLDLFYPRERPPSPTPTVLGMARPGAPGDIRGFEILREAFRIIHELRPDARLVVFGGDELPVDFPCDENLGRLSQNQLPEVYSRADVFVETSRMHGFGRTGVEAMACGAACVLSDSGGVSEYARDQFNALIVPRGDAVATAAAVIKLLSGDELRATLVRNGADAVRRYSDQVATESMLELIRRFRSLQTPTSRTIPS
jgi:glycosyltransferase involved in cell wall biosynthesis